MKQPTAAITAAVIPATPIPKSGIHSPRTSPHTTSHTRLTHTTAAQHAEMGRRKSPTMIISASAGDPRPTRVFED
jgi:hypothetical protein